MAERKDTPFTGEHFAAWCEKMVGQPYWYGGCVYKCTQSLLNRKAKQYPSHYTSSRMKRYKDDIAQKKVCADCIGGAKGYAWTNGGQGVLEAIGTDKGISNKSGANSCPDKGLVSEISAYLMIAVYKMFRLLYNAGPKNASSLFGVRKSVYSGYADAAMHVAEANVEAILSGEDIGTGSSVKDTSAFSMTTEKLSKEYPLYATSLFNLIKTSEGRIDHKK